MLRGTGAGNDDLVDPAGVRQLYDTFSSDIPRYFLFMPEAGHHAFRDECNRDCEFSQDRAHELVKRYVTASLLTHLQDNSRYAVYLEEKELPDAQFVAN